MTPGGPESSCWSNRKLASLYSHLYPSNTWKNQTVRRQRKKKIQNKNANIKAKWCSKYAQHFINDSHNPLEMFCCCLESMILNTSMCLYLFTFQIILDQIRKGLHLIWILRVFAWWHLYEPINITYWSQDDNGNSRKSWKRIIKSLTCALPLCVMRYISEMKLTKTN